MVNVPYKIPAGLHDTEMSVDPTFCWQLSNMQLLRGKDKVPARLAELIKCVISGCVDQASCEGDAKCSQAF